MDIEFSEVAPQKADRAQPLKAVTPLNNNYLYILFEKFWASYPQKKSKQKAQAVFEQLNPDHSLFETIMQALESQINHVALRQLRGGWVPPWKYPANWLANQCWNDEFTLDKTMDQTQEIKHASRQKNTRNESVKDMFWIPDESVDEPTDEQPKNNVIPFKRCK